MQNKENKVRLTEPKPIRTQTDSSSVITETETEVIFMITEPNRTHFGLTEASLLQNNLGLLDGVHGRN